MLNEAIAKMPEAFEAKILLRGEEYFQKGQVLNVRLSDGLLKGRVKGSSSQIYDVHMDLKSWPEKAARCTCAVSFNCKHAAACLLALRDKERLSHFGTSDLRLDRKLDIWLQNLRAQETRVIKRQELTHCLVYLIDLNFKGYEHKAVIELALAKKLKRGGYGKKTVLYALTESKKEYFIEKDNEIVAQLLFKCGFSGWFDRFSIRNSELLEQILATGRAFFKGADHAPLQLGEALEGSCQWVLSSNGTQRLLLRHKEREVNPIFLDECWYFDEARQSLGHLKTRYPVPKLKHLLDAPPISLDQAELLAKKMVITDPELPEPQIFHQREIKTITPQPVLVLDAVNYSLNDSSWFDGFSMQEGALLTVQLLFQYDKARIASHETCDQVVYNAQGILFSYGRDQAFEKQKMAQLRSELSLRQATTMETHLSGLKNREIFILDGMDEFADLGFLYRQVIPRLKADGWLVELASEAYQEIIDENELEWFSDLEEQSTDFFSYQLGILVEGKAVSIVPLVADLIRKHSAEELEQLEDDRLVRLPIEAGRLLQIKMGRIKPLVRLLLQLGWRQVDEHQGLRIKKYQLILMQEMELALAAVQARWRGAESLRKELKQLLQLNSLPEILPPKGLQAHLRDYQQLGLNWLQGLRSSRLAGVLADDMGLGKTVQTLAHLQYEKEQGRLNKATLIIAPTSLVGNWMAEAKRFTPELKVLVYHGTERHQVVFDAFDLVLSTYGLIHRDKEKFIQSDFYYLILDEAQFIKNAKTKTTQIIHQLKAEHRLCLTGTPLENHLGELWSLFHFLMPGLLGDARQFRTWFRTPIEKLADQERKQLLAARIKPFMLRRVKNEVAKELPPKTEMTRFIELEGPQRDLYEAIRMSMEKKVRDAIVKQGLGKSHILLLDALLKLRQVCCDPELLSVPEAVMAHGSSSKLEALMELLDNLVEEDRRVLVFSQFTSMLKIIEQKLVKKGHGFLKLTGQTQNRQDLVQTFQQGHVPIFLISLKAGGTGLNLTKADTVIHYDPWWNPAVEDQATDRTHRIGQENPVFVYKLIASRTVEEAILTLQERKRQLVDGVLSMDASQSMSFGEEDLERFFMPLV